MQSGENSRRSEVWVEDLDPILNQEYQVIYNEMICVEVHKKKLNFQGTIMKDMFNIRLMVDKNNNCFKMELNNDNNLSMVLISEINERNFEIMKEQQNLNFNFASFPQMLIKLLTLCNKDLNQYNMVLLINNISYRMVFLENIEYKKIQLLLLDLDELEGESLKNYVAYRFAKLKANNKLIQSKLKELLGIVKIKNSNLFNQITKKIHL